MHVKIFTRVIIRSVLEDWRLETVMTPKKPNKTSHESLQLNAKADPVYTVQWYEGE